MSPFTLVFALIVMYSQSSCAVTDEDGWRDAHNKVYAIRGGTHLPPPTILELLESLETYYKDKLDDGSIERDRRVRKLLSIARMKETDCDWAHLHTFSDLLNYNSIFTINVVPYIKHYRREWYSMCNEQFEAEFEQELAHLSADQRKDMTLLRNSVTKSENHLNVANYIYKLDLEEGILNFIEQQSGPFDPEAMHKRGLNEVARRFEMDVIHLCESITIELNSIMKIYSILKTDKLLVKKINHSILEWITNVNVCEDVLGSADAICRNAYHAWLSNHPSNSRKLANTILNCFQPKHSKI